MPDLDASVRALLRLRSPARQAATATALLEHLAQLERQVSSIRDEALRRLRDEGASYGSLASLSGVTRARVAQLLRRTDDADSADPAAP